MAVTKPDLIPVPFANAGAKNDIPIAPPGGADINQASYDIGFPPVTMTPTIAGGKPPKGRDMNGILYDTTSHIRYQNAGGQYWFDADFAAQIGGYPLGAVLQSSNGKSSYVSIIDNNTTDFNSDPSSIGTKWLPWAGEAVSGVPIGTIEYFAMSTPPPGYLKADGSAVGRQTYPQLFAAIGTTFGVGDGSTTFNLPDLVGRFAEGSETPGTVKEAGLPELAGTIGSPTLVGTSHVANGVFASSKLAASPNGTNINWLQNGTGYLSQLNYRASEGNPIYGASDTVQPPALTLLPCIKAFDATVNSGLIDVTALAQDIAGKVDKVIEGKNIAYVVDSYNDMQGNWWREWSDGWLEQGGLKRGNGIYAKVTINLLRPFAKQDYTLTTGSTIGGGTWYTSTSSAAFQAPTSDVGGCFTDKTINSFGIQGFSDHSWYACGQGAQS